MDTYTLEPPFQAAVVAHAVYGTKYADIAYAVDPVLFHSDPAARVIKAVNYFIAEHGIPPRSDTVVVQSLRTEVDQGRMDPDVYEDAVCYLAEAQVMTRPDLEDPTIAKLTDIVKDFQQHQRVLTLFDAHGQRRDIAPHLEKLLDVQSIGVQKLRTPSFTLDRGLVKLIREAEAYNRMPTGADGLDMLMDGGLARKTIGLIMAKPGFGKSMFLNQIVATALMQGFNVGFVSLENPMAELGARIFASMSGLPIDICKRMPDMAFDVIEGRGIKIGYPIFWEMSPEGQTVKSVIEDLERHERDHGVQIDVLVIDYLDRLSGGMQLRGKNQNSYETGRDITQAFRNYVFNRNLWGWSATQPKAQSGKAEFHVDSTSDSAHKQRITDVLIGLEVYGDRKGLIHHICASLLKHRQGQAWVKTPPVLYDTTRATVFPGHRFQPYVPTGLEGIDFLTLHAQALENAARRFNAN